MEQLAIDFFTALEKEISISGSIMNNGRVQREMQNLQLAIHNENGEVGKGREPVPLMVCKSTVCSLSSSQLSMNFSILSWNVRGLGRPEKRSIVNEVARLSKVEIVFLQESKLKIHVMPGMSL